MKKSLIFIALIGTGILFSFQNFMPKKGYKEIHYKDVEPIKTDDYWMSFSDMHSQEDFVQFKVEVLNKTQDYLVLSLDKFTFKTDGGEVHGKVKEVIIKPGATKNITVRGEGIPGLPAEKVDVKFDGIKRIPIDLPEIQLEDYPLPDTKKEVKAANCLVRLTKISKETKATDAKWEVENIGDTPLLMDPALPTMTVEGKDEQWPNEVMSTGYKIIWPGKTAGLKGDFRIPAANADMQFANLIVHWNKTFIQSKEVPVAGGSFALEMDLGKTEGHN